jgi:2,3-dihydroxybenzoate decarboxylase
VKKIALEEHFWIDGFPHTARTGATLFEPWFIDSITAQLPDFSELRIQAMDKAGIDVAVLSLVSPGIQTERDGARAVTEARRANDALAAEIQKSPRRFAGFAHLAMQDPTAAAAELERSVRHLGFKGALINGHTNGEYLDDEKYLPFWETVQDLDIPIYLHPAHMPVRPVVFEGYPALDAAMWGWTAETGGHALRLVLSGLFDRLPKLKVILGHLGEGLPYFLWRIDSRFRIRRPKVKLEKSPSDYIRQNIYVTTAGSCQPEALVCAMKSMGVERVMFSVDYPLEDCQEAAEFIETAPISQSEREAICWGNAAQLLRL